MVLMGQDSTNSYFERSNPCESRPGRSNIEDHPDYPALSGFYYATNGTLWNNDYGWLVCEVCNWAGITCENDRVTEIRLPSNNLDGVFNEDFGELEFLKVLDISNNNVNHFNANMSTLNNLEYIDVSQNGFNTALPDIFGGMGMLKYFDFSTNAISNPLPSSIRNSGSLEVIIGSENLFSGSFANNSAWNNSIKELRFASNQFSSVSSFTYSNLEILDLNNNLIGGSLPAISSSQLRYLDFSNNRFASNIPFSYANYSNLNHVDLSHNNIDGFFLQGFGTLSQLNHLDLSDNRITGCIPESYSNLCGRSVDLDDNCTFEDPNFLEFCSGEVCNESLSLSGTTQACAEQVLTISGPTGYASYDWGDGPTSNSSITRTAGNGKFYLTVTNSKSCTRSDSFIVNIVPLPPQQASVSFCEGEDVSYNGVTYDSPGTFTQNLSNGQGCPYVLSVLVTEDPRPKRTIEIEICPGGSEIVHGVIYDSEGSFLQDVNNPLGCDSLLTIDVLVLESFEEELSFEICEGTTMTLNGEILSIGPHQQILTAANGCDSVLNIEVNPLEHTSSVFSAEACPGEFTPVNGIDYLPGSYEQEFTNAAGCDSTLYIQIALKSETSSSVSFDICSGQSVEVNGETLTGGEYEQLFVNSQGCDSTLYISIDETPPYDIYDTLVMCDGNTVNYGYYHYFSSPGDFEFMLVDNEDCDFRVNLHIIDSGTRYWAINVTLCDGSTQLVNGQLFKHQGVYLQELETHLGCDSLLTVHIFEEVSTNEEIDINLCDSEAFHANGETFVDPGSYVQSLVNAKGCDSTLYINIERNYSTSETINLGVCNDQSVNVNGQSYSVEGTYFQTLENAAGCDSLLTIEIVENGISYENIAFNLCGDEYATVNGVDYEVTGLYEQSFLTEKGCDSILIIDVEINPHTQETVDLRLCTGDEILVNNIAYTEGGSFIQHLSNVAGCDSTLRLEIDEFSPSQGYESRTICEGETTVINGVAYSEGGQFEQVLSNSVLCDSILNIQIVENLETEEIIYESHCEGEFTTVNGLIYDESGTYFQTLTNVANCDSNLTIVVEEIDIAYGYLSQDLCEGMDVTINGVIYDSSITDTQELLTTKGCDSLLTVTIVERFNSEEAISRELCVGSIVEVNGVEYSTGGIKIQHLLNYYGCDSTLTIDVTEKLPTSSFLEREICEDDYTVINGEQFGFGGSFTQVLENAVGCDSTIFISIIEHPHTSETLLYEICPGEKVIVNAQEYTVPSIYQQELENIRGCDSTIIIDVRYLPPSDTLIYGFICEESSYLIDGKEFTEPGDYQIERLTSRGCDSIINLNLSLLSGQDTTIIAEVCQGSSYSFGDKKYNSPGVYNDSILIDGCRTAATLELSLIAPVHASTIETICEGESYYFYGSILQESGSYTKTIPTHQGCDSILTLELNIASEKSSYIDTFICEGSSVYYDFFLYTQPGSYSKKKKTIHGCDSIVYLTIEAYDSEEDVFNFEVCEGDSISFENMKYGVGTHSGTYFDGNCDQGFLLEITQSEKIENNLTYIMCEGDSILFDNFYYHETGQYLVNIERDHCEFVKFLNIIEWAEGGGELLFFLCDNNHIVLNENTYYGGDTVEADYGECTTNQILTLIELSSDTVEVVRVISPGQSIYINNTSYNQTGEYFIEVETETNCSSMLLLRLLVQECGGISEKEVRICEGESYEFYGSAINEAGTYEFPKFLSEGCDSIFRVHLEVEENIDFAIQGGTLICSGNPITLIGPPGYQYYWNTASTSQEITVTQSGEYTLDLISEDGCVSQSSISVSEFNFPSSALVINTIKPSTCVDADGSIFVEVDDVEKFTFSIDGGITWQASNKFENLGQGIYPLLLANLDQTCVRNAAININLDTDKVPSIIDVLLTPVNQCVGDLGSIEIISDDAGQDLEYSIDGGDTWEDNSLFTDLSEDTYKVLVRDRVSECVNYGWDSITINSTPILEFETDHTVLPTCTYASDGLISISILNGTEPYSITWSNGDTSTTIEGLENGTYSVTVSDANNCTSYASIELDGIDLNEHLSQFVDQSICEDDSIRFSELDSSLNYFLFKDNMLIGNDSELSISETGMYEIIVSRGPECHDSKTFNVTYQDATEKGIDFLISSRGVKDVEVEMINISDPMPEDFYWKFDEDRVDVVYSERFTQRIIFRDTGLHVMSLISDIEGCNLALEKQIRIYPDSTYTEFPENQGSLISTLEYFNVLPNPNDGNFKVEIGLSEVTPASLSIYNMNGALIEKRALSRSDRYEELFNLSTVNSGVYSVFLEVYDRVHMKQILILR